MKAWWNRRYPDWVPEIALRYLPVVEAIRAQPAHGAILEVGVNRSGLTTYLPVPAVGVDCMRRTVHSPLVTPVVAKVHALPFQTMAFDPPSVWTRSSISRRPTGTSFLLN